MPEQPEQLEHIEISQIKESLSQIAIHTNYLRKHAEAIPAEWREKVHETMDLLLEIVQSTQKSE